MAKQCGPVYFEKTFDELVLYKMEGKYYARKKSSLTSERVKTSDEFRWTMALAGIMGRASKIGAAVYKALPPGWRQFWMYRSFTGEAFTLLNESPYTDEEVKQLLWKCYVEYWEQVKAADPGNPIFQPKPKKIRKRRKYSEESLLRKKDKNGKPLWRDPEVEERKRLALEKKRAWCKQQLEKEEQQAALAGSLPAINHPATLEEPKTQNPKPEINQAVTPKQSEILHSTSAINSTWQVSADGSLHTAESPLEINQAVTPRQSGILNATSGINQAVTPEEPGTQNPKSISVIHQHDPHEEF